MSWYVLGMGNENDLQSPHWHGRTLRYQLRNTDVIELLPGSMATAEWWRTIPARGCCTVTSRTTSPPAC